MEDILKTPLFTYEYKTDHPEKSRMGIISEELPEHLQIKDKGQPSQPDWPSIYGSFWAGIKALHERLELLKQELSFEITKREKALSQKLEDFKQEVFSKFKSLSSHFKELNNKLKKLVTKFTQFQTEFFDFILVWFEFLSFHDMKVVSNKS